MGNNEELTELDLLEDEQLDHLLDDEVMTAQIMQQRRMAIQSLEQNQGWAIVMEILKQTEQEYQSKLLEISPKAMNLTIDDVLKVFVMMSKRVQDIPKDLEEYYDEDGKIL